MTRFAGPIPSSTATDRIKCVRCAKWLPTTAAFCRRCGMRTGVPLPPPMAAPLPSSPPYAMPSPPRAVLPAATVPRPYQLPAGASGGVKLPYEPLRPAPPRQPFFQSRCRPQTSKGAWVVIVIAFLMVRGMTGLSHWVPGTSSWPPSSTPRYAAPPRAKIPAMPPPMQPRGVYTPLPPYLPPSYSPPGTSPPANNPNAYPPYRPGTYTPPGYGSPTYPTSPPGAPGTAPAGRVIPGTSYYIDIHGRVVNPTAPAAASSSPAGATSSRGR